MKAECEFEVNGFSLKEADRYILKDVSFSILQGECWAVTGHSGSGKSALLKSIMNYKMLSNSMRFGNNYLPVLKLISHQHRFQNRSGMSDFYYQQRFNSTESDDADTLLEDLLKVKNDKKFALASLDLLRIKDLANTPMIKLSNGEHKRFQIAKALYENADWLLLDDPFTGLDAEARNLLNEILASLIRDEMKCLIVCGREIPEFITHVATLKNGMLTGVHTRKNFLQKRKPASSGKLHLEDVEFPVPEAEFEFAVRMHNVSVMYHGRTILSEINWSVRNGEKWCITGPNGSGKSTLLSLITADNPQAFANDIYLFDRKKGSGETIWEIKKRIGFVSPELHQYFDRTMSCFKVVASGLFDTVGLFKKMNQEQMDKVNHFLGLFELKRISEKPLGALSQGMQRWVLLARALIKNPPLIILDEPCQGLDDDMCMQFIAFIEKYCNTTGRTLLYVTHVAEEIPACIGKMIKLKEGKIIEISNYHEKKHNSHSGRRDRA